MENQMCNAIALNSIVLYSLKLWASYNWNLMADLS